MCALSICMMQRSRLSLPRCHLFSRFCNTLTYNRSLSVQNETAMMLSAWSIRYYAVCAHSPWFFRGSMQNVVVNLNIDRWICWRSGTENTFTWAPLLVRGIVLDQTDSIQSNVRWTLDSWRLCKRPNRPQVYLSPVLSTEHMPSIWTFKWDGPIFHHCCSNGWTISSACVCSKKSALWQLATQRRSSMNKIFSINSFGHTGNCRSFDCDMHSCTKVVWECPIAEQT